MTVFQLKKIVLAVSLCTPLLAHAAGLGALISGSRLGEPLNAEIELLSVSPSDLNTLRAALASDQIYQEQSLEKPASSALIRIEVAKNSKGQPILKLSSSAPINEAFLDMLIEVEWTSGRLIKEYTLLLDPPGYQSNSVTDAADLPVLQDANRKSVNLPEKKSAEIAQPEKPTQEKQLTEKPATAQQMTAVAPLPDQANMDAHTSVNGDTLYAIARQMKPPGVSVEQMVAALYQANQQAFEAENMHRLKTGKILRAPNQSQLDSVTQQQARILIAAHTAAWHVYKNAVAGSVVHAATQSENRLKTEQSGKIAAPAKPLPQASVSKDVLKLSAEKSAQSHPQEKLNAAREEETAKNNQLKEQQSRAEALNKQLADIKKLMALKNEAMAKAQAEAEKNKTEGNKTEQVKTEIEPKYEQPLQPPASETPAQHESVQPEKEAPAPVEAQSVKNAFLTQVLTYLKLNKLTLFVLAVLPVLLGLWLWVRRRQKNQINQFAEGIATSDVTQLSGNTLSATQPVNSMETSLMTDFAQSPVAGVIDANDVDPISEAEVYIAYGRDAQAEEILKDAISKDPGRQELKLKLLEIYHQSQTVATFNALAGDLYAQSPEAAVWDKVVVMGQALDATNPLYRQLEVSAQAQADAPSPTAETVNAAFELADQSLSPSLSELSSSSKDDAQIVLADDVDSSETFTNPAAESRIATSAQTSIPESTISEAALTTPDVEDAGLSFSSTALSGAGSAAGEGSLNLSEPESAEKSLPEVDATPKELDLPELDFEKTEVSPPLTLAQSELGAASLSPDDAVFETLPDLSFELGLSLPASELDASSPDTLLENPDIATDELDQGRLESMSSNPNPTHSVDMDRRLEELANLPDMALDSPASFPASSEGEPEEVDTKLDLIKAYIDMEDMVGAKELIEEVLEEGGPNQRRQAQALLKQIA